MDHSKVESAKFPRTIEEIWQLAILDPLEVLEMALADSEKAAWESKANSVPAQS
jgi:hypothetical protein